MDLRDFDAKYCKIIDASGDRYSHETRALVHRTTPDIHIRQYLFHRTRQLDAGDISPLVAPDVTASASAPPAPTAQPKKKAHPMPEPKRITRQQQFDLNLKTLTDSLGMSRDEAYSRALSCNGPVKLTANEVQQVEIRAIMATGKTLDEATTLVMNDKARA